MKNLILKIGALFCCLVLSGCLFGGVKKTGKVTGYKKGKVITKDGYYEVGALPPEWKTIDLEKALVAFRNDGLNSTISTDSFCKRAYNDSPLNSLTRHLLMGLEDVEILKEEPLTLADRGALKTSIQAKLDGVPVKMAVVVLKKDWCLYDFFLVSTPDQYENALPDFETFYRGFVSREGE